MSSIKSCWKLQPKVLWVLSAEEAPFLELVPVKLAKQVLPQPYAMVPEGDLDISWAGLSVVFLEVSDVSLDTRWFDFRM